MWYCPVDGETFVIGISIGVPKCHKHDCDLVKK